MTEALPSSARAHAQAAYAVRFEWGPTGAAAVADGADVAVVVDVLSFTTTVCVAIERGMTVLPFRWRDERAAEYAAEREATLALGRHEARAAQQAGRADAVSLSPVAIAESQGIARLVLPSPNGSSICFALADSGVAVVAACLRNRSAVAAWLALQVTAGRRLAVVAAGERWPDGSLRPAVEDLWGVGAVLAALVDLGHGGLSPEATVAEQAFRAVADRLSAAMESCASGRELAAAGFGEDVEVAAQLDASPVVPMLGREGFADARS